MSAFTLVVSSTLDMYNYEQGFDTLAQAEDVKGGLSMFLVADGWNVDAFDDDCLWKDDDVISLDIEPEVDEENESPWSEYEQGWRNIRADEAAAVARQVREDDEYAQRWVAPTYMGIRGSFEPDGGVIYEP